MAAIRTHRIADGVMYAHHPPHRDGTIDKSQWRITEQDERSSFQDCRTKHWFSENTGWGLHFANGSVSYLGMGRDHQTSVFVAKFVSQLNRKLWHGYPADHQRSTTDIPSEAVRRQWLEFKLLTAAKIRKLSRGQPCSL